MCPEYDEKKENVLLCLFLFFIWMGGEASQRTKGSTYPQPQARSPPNPQQKPSPKPEARQTPRSPEKPIYPNVFLNWYREGASLVSVERLFHILAPRKEKAFCPGVVFFLGNLTSVLVLRRFREEHELFLLKSSHRYLGARFLRGLKVTIFDCVFINCCMVFHPKLSNIGLIAASKLLFVTIIAALFWSLCKC